MLRKLILSVVTFLAISTVTVQAQRNDGIRNIYFDTIGGAFQPTMVGVDEMKYIDNEYITHADTLFMRYTTATIQNDINFYADFELVPIDSFYLKTYEIEELDPLGWNRLGATYLVKLEAEFPGSKIRARWRLIDTARRQHIDRGTITVPKGNWRRLGHRIANEIVHALTGDRGIFLTKIVYVKKMGKAKEIFMADYDGLNERQLTNTGTINLSPSISPNGKEVYFTSYLNDSPQLFKVEIKNLKMSQVAAFPGIIAAPSVSPDGKRIACVLSKDGNSEIYILSTKGKIIKRLTRHRAIDSAPTWSPAGDRIAFSSDRSGSPQIYMMDDDGSNLTRLTYQGKYNDSPIWSERGGRITFVSRTKYGRFDLASIRVDGTDYRIMTEVGMNENPHFSPDGKHIVFSSNRLGPRDIFTMDINGRNQKRLTRSGAASNPVWGPIN